MSKHTPGEWFIDRGFRDAMYGGEHTTIEDDFLTIYCDDVFDPDQSDWFEVRGPNQVANARLIAAAPEMLEALKAVLAAPIVYDGGGDLKSIDECGHDGLQPLREHLRAAIAKAEGK